MNKSIPAIVTLSLLLTACSNPQELGEGSQRRLYQTYGVFNESSIRSKRACYEVSMGNVVWSIILIETIIAPVYFVGWSLYNPTRLKHGPDDECTIDS
jgi:starvation-inducible outer membrane lipoprotein